MTPAPTGSATETPVPVTDPPATVDEQLVEDSLVEEVSIDGMCGVY